jgi:hypothetical protein
MAATETHTPMMKHGVSREKMISDIDKPTLKPTPI